MTSRNGGEYLDVASVAILPIRRRWTPPRPHGKAMLHMAAVFAELERGMIRERVMAGLERAKAQGVTLGRPKVARKVENAIRTAGCRSGGRARATRWPAAFLLTARAILARLGAHLKFPKISSALIWRWNKER